MKATLIATDGSGNLSWGEAPAPALGSDTVLVDVHATAVNRADLLQRRGLYPPPPGESAILGLEAAGIVAAVGAGVTRVRPGDRVCCLLAGGGYAEQVVVHEAMALPIPDGLDFAQAAAIPEAFYTAFVNIVQEGSLARGERVLVHAGASGVGTAAIQLVKARGAVVYVTAGSDEKVARCVALGAEAGVNYKTESFAERIAALTGKQGVDVILDCVGGSYLEPNIASLKPRGRLVVIGLMGGVKAEVNLGLLVSRRLRIVGSVLRSRSLAEKIAITDAFAVEVLPLFRKGALQPIVDRVYPITDAAAAHDYVAANRNFGKVVLRVRD
ncbi:MAG: NADPH:quinone oxidoreductase [Polyangiaceae bacterium UTPRO1]|nr:NAD(P)H-quinone oxidoreductase [Myxococcales bacterium]OQY64885.1 MAG: NADPH:quinone oxidoreductase [Polyangiaceae bacterium UTPRO1]